MLMRKRKVWAKPIALLVAFSLVQSLAIGGYNWTTDPAHDAVVNTDPFLPLSATVTWGLSDYPLFNGSVMVTPIGYTGKTIVGTYAYQGDAALRQGLFTGAPGPSFNVTFDPPLSPETSVEVEFTAQSKTVTMPPTTVSSNVTITVKTPEE